MIKKTYLYIVAVFFVVYVAYSQFLFSESRVSLDEAKTRVENISYQLEFWKTLSIKAGVVFDLGQLISDYPDIVVTKIDESDALDGVIENGGQLYVLTYDSPKGKPVLDRYFSELVLSNYFYVVTNSQGEVQSMFWDKP